MPKLIQHIYSLRNTINSQGYVEQVISVILHWKFGQCEFHSPEGGRPNRPIKLYACPTTDQHKYYLLTLYKAKSMDFPQN